MAVEKADLTKKNPTPVISKELNTLTSKENPISDGNSIEPNTTKSNNPITDYLKTDSKSKTLTELMTGESDVDDETSKKQEPKYIKKEREKLRKEAVKELLEDLGVAAPEELKEKVGAVDDLRSEVEKLRDEIRIRDMKLANEKKYAIIRNALDRENCFDSDVIANLIELDKIKLSENGEINNIKDIVEMLKERKPHFFGKGKPKGDSFIGSTAENNFGIDYNELLKQHDYVGIWSNIIKEKGLVK